eukprot:gb/GFBE01023116.1/.p1 GENE.gb/GFBE01023116.1/~~gb/GFBE01023116.1/.p1  ORF type:complete len:159 (+),score=13.51 gb/GFBE01023116.1/:1-477(+)
MAAPSDLKSGKQLRSAAAAALTPRTPRTPISPTATTVSASPSDATSAGSTFRRSAALGFLEEKLEIRGADVARPGTRECLYRGVSADGQGRKEYLRRRAKYGVEERYGRPATEAQVMALSMKMGRGAHPPAFGHKPVIAQSFYRTRGSGGFQEATAAF